MTQREKLAKKHAINSKTYHLISTENKNQTKCGKAIQVGDGKPQVLLSSTPDRVVGKICARCQNPSGATAVKKNPTERTAKVPIPVGKIRVLAEKNPRHEGTRAHKQFALYKNGMTSAEFLAAGGTNGDLRWDLKRKHIEIK